VLAVWQLCRSSKPAKAGSIPPHRSIAARVRSPGRTDSLHRGDASPGYRKAGARSAGRGRGTLPLPPFFAPSTQGERARLLPGNEAGSIPAGRANPSRRVLGTARIPNPRRSVRFASAGASLRCDGRRARHPPAKRDNAVRIRLAPPAFHGGLGELENTARRERATTGSIPVGHPNFAGIVQWQDSRPVSGRRRFDSILPAPNDAVSSNGRTARSEGANRGSIPRAAAIRRGLLKERASL
jgi:hypothetical protein